MSIIWSLIVEEKEKGLLQKEKGLNKKKNY
jgi:hypothetical protein